MLRETCSLGLFLVLAAGPLAAQRPNTREGFWIGLGAGFGSVGTTCPNCSTDRTSGSAGYLRLGGTLSPVFQLGGESDGWFHSASGVNETLGFASFIANIYPSRTGAFFLKVGIGGMSYRADDGSGLVLTATAPSGTLGAGYDVRVARNFSLTPFINGLATSAVSFKVGGVTVTTDNFKVNLVQIGLGVTWH
jgi:hypothetical protein